MQQLQQLTIKLSFRAKRDKLERLVGRSVTQGRKAMNEKQYMIDDEPASANDIIRKAKELDTDYGSDGICQTSVAAGVLRRNGHTVGHNPDYAPNAGLDRHKGAR